jgi:hypothetical protein
MPSLVGLEHGSGGDRWGRSDNRWGRDRRRGGHVNRPIARRFSLRPASDSAIADSDGRRGGTPLCSKMLGYATQNVSRQKVLGPEQEHDAICA